MPRKICEWTEIEPGTGVYNTCTNGEEFHLYEGLDLWPYCHWCGGKIKVVEFDPEEDAIVEARSYQADGGADDAA